MNKLVFELYVFFTCFSQQVYSDFEERKNADRLIVFSAVEKHAQNYTADKNYLVFSILGKEDNKSHLIVVEEKRFYRELYIINDTLINIEKCKPNKALKLAFNKEIYHTDIRYIDDYPENLVSSGGNPAYFCFVDKNKNSYGESITGVFGPLIDRNVHFYLLGRITRNIHKTIE